MLNELSDALVGSAACFLLQVLVCFCLEASLGDKKAKVSSKTLLDSIFRKIKKYKLD